MPAREQRQKLEQRLTEVRNPMDQAYRQMILRFLRRNVNDLRAAQRYKATQCYVIRQSLDTSLGIIPASPCRIARIVPRLSILRVGQYRLR